MKIISVVCILVLLVLSVQTAWYISPNGSNSNSGTEQSPFATLNHALAVANTSSDKQIFVLPGTFNGEQVTLYFPVNISSTNGSSQTQFSGYELTILSSGCFISGITFTSCPTITIDYPASISNSVVEFSIGQPAIFVAPAGYLTLFNSNVTNNQQSGIVCNGICNIMNSQINNNFAAGSNAGGITFNKGLGFITNTTINGNGASGNISVPAAMLLINSIVSFANSSASFNRANNIAGWSCQSSTFHMSYVNFTNNIATYSNGYSVGYCNLCEFDMTSLTLSGNTPAPSGQCEGWDRRPQYDIGGGNVAYYYNIPTEAQCATICYLNPRYQCNAYVYGVGGGFEQQCYIKHPSVPVWSYLPSVVSAFWTAL